MSVGHHYTQANINTVNNIWTLLQTTGGKDEPTTVFNALFNKLFQSVEMVPLVVIVLGDVKGVQHVTVIQGSVFL